MVVYAVVFPTLKLLYVGATIQKAFRRWRNHYVNIENLVEALLVGSAVVSYLINRATNEGPM